jgi:hypothetical protein
MRPGRALFKAILQRGIDRGEFRPMDTDTSVFSLVSTIFFLSMWRHSLAPCDSTSTLNPQVFLQNHVDALIRGWQAA